LFIDGEMPLRLLRKRMELLADQLQLQELPNLHYVSWQEASLLTKPKPKAAKDDETTDPEWAPLNMPEGQAFIRELCDKIKPDVVIFDNVQCLLAGDMREETPWNETQPLVLELTRRGVAQIWADHTGHDQTRQYGSSRKQWAFDTVMMVNRAELGDADLALAVNFEAKARNRSPENRHEYDPCIARLQGNAWTSEKTDQRGRTEREARFGKLGPDAKELFCIIKNLLAAGRGEQVSLPDMAPVQAVGRKALRAACIDAGWFSEGELESKPASSTLTQRGYDREDKALKALKNKGLIGRERHWVWLL
jgi:hypothetical protein